MCLHTEKLNESPLGRISIVIRRVPRQRSGGYMNIYLAYKIVGEQGRDTVLWEVINLEKEPVTNTRGIVLNTEYIGRTTHEGDPSFSATDLESAMRDRDMNTLNLQRYRELGVLR